MAQSFSSKRVTQGPSGGLPPLLLWLLLVLVNALIMLQQPAAAEGAMSEQGAAPPKPSNRSTIQLIVIGDSTAANYTSYPQLYPLSGWAMFLQPHLLLLHEPAVVVRDLAVAGRSSKSYYLDGFWHRVTSSYLSPGDYVFIQFGHNDQSSIPHRHTDPFTTFTYYLSLYVNETRAAQAHPVLLTPISRALWNVDGSLRDTFGNYTVTMRRLADRLQVPLIDLNRDTAALFSKLGEQTTQHTLFMCLPAGRYPNYPKGIHDTTHLQVEGAKQVAALAAQGIAKAHLPLL